MKVSFSSCIDNIIEGFLFVISSLFMIGYLALRIPSPSLDCISMNFDRNLRKVDNSLDMMIRVLISVKLM